MSKASTIALAQFKTALDRHLGELLRLDHADLVERCVELCREHDYEGATIGDLLMRAAHAGSIEAAAALIAIGVDESTVANALQEMVTRYPDVKEGLLIEALAEMFEEWADEEVAAGRMTLTRGPNGEKLYGTPKGKTSRAADA